MTTRVNDILNILTGNGLPARICLATAVLFVLVMLGAGLCLTLAVSRKDNKTGRIWDGFMMVLMVIPPTVVELMLLILAGKNRPDTGLLRGSLAPVYAAWTISAAVAILVAFPMMYRSVRGAIRTVDPDTILAARTLGMPEGRIFRKVILPKARPGIIAGILLSLARFVGEYGAGVIIASDLENREGTVGAVLRSVVTGGEYAKAWMWLAVWYAGARLVLVILNAAANRHHKKKHKRVAAGDAKQG